MGIDTYAGGPHWDLAGPVDDAVRLARWFGDRGVPSGQVFLLASPLDAVHDLPVRRAPADRATVRELFLRTLPARAERRLYVHWGGHGYLDPARRRRVYCADATLEDPVDVDLDALLATYATDLVPFDTQAWFVDACLTHERPLAATVARGHEDFPRGRPAPDRAIDMLFAAGFGEPAVNLSLARTGLFTRELLPALGTGWPPDPARLIDELRRRFGELRALGRTGQTPTYIWYRTAAGDEGQLLQRPLSGTPRAAGRTAGLDLVAVRQAVDTLVVIDEFLRPTGRDEILSLVRREVCAAIPRNPAARLDAVAIVRTCQRFPGALVELAQALRFVAPHDPAAARFAELAVDLTPAPSTGAD